MFIGTNKLNRRTDSADTERGEQGKVAPPKELGEPHKIERKF